MPVTTRVVKSIPNLYQAMFSILEPGKSLVPHRSPYAGYVRCHLGLMMPQSNPPRLRVMDQTYTWKEGEAALFDDNIEHEVCNESRVVLIVDILRPMSRLKHWLNRYIVKRYIQPNYANQVLHSMKEDSRKHTAAG